jgi:hypothetical protein
MFKPLLHPPIFAMRNCLTLCLSAILILLLSLKTSAQNVISISQELKWASSSTLDNPNSGDLLFEPSFLDDSGSHYFVYRQALATNASVIGYRFSAAEVTSLPKNIEKNISINSLSNDWKVTAKVTDGGGTPYLVVKVMPIRIQNGNLEALRSFALDIELGNPTSTRNRTLTFADNSVLAEGTWFKIAIARDGIYKVDKNTFDQLGVDVTAIDPNQINIYGNGGSLLPTSNAAPRPDDLVKNAIVFQDNDNDQSFDASDFFLFYGKGPDRWDLSYDAATNRSRWIQTKHYYSDSAYYFIRIDDVDPLRVSNATLSDNPEDRIVSTFPDYQFIENELFNLASSGRELYGDLFDNNLNATFPFTFPNVVSVSATADFSLASRSIGAASSFNYSLPGTTGSISINAVTTGATSDVAGLARRTFTFTPTSAAIPVALTYVKANADAQGWLDYITINATRNLAMTGNQLFFRDTLSSSASETALFQLTNAAIVQRIFDITDPYQPRSIPFTLNGTTAEWKMEIQGTRQFVAFAGSGFLTPTAKGGVANQNLHALTDVDLMIVTAPLHLTAAEAIAEIHTNLGKTVAIATLPQVLNEFSSGNPDVTAIRMLMKMLYDRANGDEGLLPENLLLFGDGAYNANKSLETLSQYNMILFESDNSVSPIRSYVSDDYFVFLSDDDDADPSNALDCGVGRIPASNATQASQYLAKVRKYVSENTSPDGGAYQEGDAAKSPFGNWRNILTFVADDFDGNGAANETVHTRDSDDFARQIEDAYPEYDIQKIYMDSYIQEVTPGGERYPDGEDAIRRRVENGSLLVTYIGHGGERGWGHERILDIPTIQNFGNYNRLPVFLTATCELARFDDPGYFSAGEALLLNPDGGAIAMLTTTRIVFSGSNQEMDQAFFDHSFQERTISNLTLGKLNMLTKNNVSVSNTSKPNFSLLGDPALQMAYPDEVVYTTKINDIDITAFTDTLKALQEVEFTGFVGDHNGTKLTSFNGFVYPVVFDKQSTVNTQNNDNGPGPVTFKTYDKVLFRGKASVSNGDFSFRFVVPFDINYSIDSARISYYAVAGNVDAHGYDNSFLLGSVLSGAQLNSVGPEIELFMNDTTFISGGITNNSPVLLGLFKDDNGINTSGNGIGHDLTAVLDENTNDPLILNEYYVSDLDTYQSGSVRFPLNSIDAGDHTLKVKAWDVHNNSSEKSIEFTVADDAVIALERVLNYPNPFTTSTQFFFEHNQADQNLEVRIQIFTVSGKLVKTLTDNVNSTGFRSTPIPWDGKDDFGDPIGKGVYVYKVEIRNENGDRAEQFEKLVILK